jgi:hypothetical protein
MPIPRFNLMENEFSITRSSKFQASLTASVQWLARGAGTLPLLEIMAAGSSTETACWK